MRKSICKITTLCLSIVFASPVIADSFFDVFFDVTYDTASEAPQLKVSSRVVTPGSGVKPVETKVVSMSSSSHRGMEDGSMSYSSSVAVRSWLSSRDGKTKPVDSFFDVYYKCVTLEKRETKCVITNTAAKTKGKHRGHVTVLK